MTTSFSSQRLLQDALTRNPRASLDEIRTRHPVLRTMSVDQLSVQLSRLIDSAADARGK